MVSTNCSLAIKRTHRNLKKVLIFSPTEMGIFDKIKEAANKAGNFIKTAAVKVYTTVKKVAPKVLEAAKTAGKAVVDKASEIGTKVISAGTNIITAPVNLMKTLIIVGGVIAGGAILYALMNPKETAAIVHDGTSMIASKAVPPFPI